MDFSSADFVSLASLAVSLAALAKVFFGVAHKLASIEVKVDTMWDFTLRRARSEAVVRGFADINSPITFTAVAEELIAPFAESLRDLYSSLGGPKIGDTELAVEIEVLFGQRLLNEICIPHNLYMGTCLILAIEAAKGNIGRAAGARQQAH